MTRPALAPHELRKLVIELSKLAPRRWGPGTMEQQIRKRGFRITGPEISAAMEELGLLTHQEQKPSATLPMILDAIKTLSER